MLLLSSRQDLTDVRPQEYIAYGLEACEYSSILNDSSYQSLASCVVTVDLFIFLKWPRSHRCCLHVAEYWSTQGHACQYFTSTAESWCKCTEVVVMKRLYSESGLFQLRRLGAMSPLRTDANDGPLFPLRQCQQDCLDACAKGARVIEMACGTGKTRVMKELVSNISGKVPGRFQNLDILYHLMKCQSLTCDHTASSPTCTEVLIIVPLLALLDQFPPDFPGFCKVGMGHNKKIDFEAKGFIAVTDSVHLLEKVKFDSIFMDEAHHKLPARLPKSRELYQFLSHLRRGCQCWFSVSDGESNWRWSFVWLWHNRPCADCPSCICVLGRLASQASWEVQTSPCILQLCCRSEAISDGVERSRVGGMAHQWEDASQKAKCCDGRVCGSFAETGPHTCHSGGLGGGD